MHSVIPMTLGTKGHAKVFCMCRRILRKLLRECRHFESSTKDGIWAGEMAQWGESLVGKPEDLSSIPGNYVVKGENRFLQVVCMHAHIHTQINMFFKKRWHT